MARTDVVNVTVPIIDDMLHGLWLALNYESKPSRRGVFVAFIALKKGVLPNLMKLERLEARRELGPDKHRRLAIINTGIKYIKALRNPPNIENKKGVKELQLITIWIDTELKKLKQMELRLG